MSTMSFHTSAAVGTFILTFSLCLGSGLLVCSYISLSSVSVATFVDCGSWLLFYEPHAILCRKQTVSVFLSDLQENVEDCFFEPRVYL